jgi:hypothetical protein
VCGKAKGGAGYGYTKKLGYRPLLATRADTGEVLHARMRKGAANTQRGTVRFVEELVARVRRAVATGELIMRFGRGIAFAKDAAQLPHADSANSDTNGTQPNPPVTDDTATSDQPTLLSA